ncbi:MAG: RlmE family RNA methyltransferase [Sphingomonadales bacterium]
MAKKKSSSSAVTGRTRGPKVRVKTARGRKLSSTRWLERQLNDPYVAEARRLGYRSRATFKLIDLDEQFELLKSAKRIVDLGAAPGGWSAYVAQRNPGAEIDAIDLLEIAPIADVQFKQMDFMAPGADDVVKAMLGGPVDLVLSDLAPSTTGHKSTDALRTMALCEAAFLFACDTLRPAGNFVAKVQRGGTDHELLVQMRKAFKTVKHVKPPSSRSDSSEWFVVALGFRR